MSKPLFNIAHRGGKGAGPENSLAAISHAVALGVDAVEIDLWSVDGTLWVSHDRRLGRTVAGEGRFDALNGQQIAALALDNKEPIPTLDQVFELIHNRALLNIEIKGPNTAPLLCQWLLEKVLQQGVDSEQFLLSSFDHIQLLYCLQRVPTIRRGVLIEGIPLGLKEICAHLEAYSFNPSINFLNRDTVRSAQQAGLKTYVYTVNDPDDWQLMKDWGVDGVFTDYPDRLRRWEHGGNP